jgi:hypothetical protein
MPKAFIRTFLNALGMPDCLGELFLAQVGKGMVRSERIDVLNGDRIALDVIKRDCNQEEHCQQRDDHHEVTNHLPLVSLSFGWLKDHGTPDGLAHIGMMSVFYTRRHWNVHGAPSFLTT